ncbi:MAG: hypothetical protein DSY66_00165 [Persephonella sp.]|nr:MAG: hypothetical protein DSY53_04510 [Persephonella sp.]RUM62317.1 MAG: hypothetical protein DSY66_00165 [Persephonella sp.]
MPSDLKTLQDILNINSLLENPHTKLLISKKEGKILKSSKEIEKDIEKFFNHLVKVDKDMLELIFEGWHILSGKYPVLPIKYFGIVGKDITLLFNGDFAVILDTPESFLQFHSTVLSKDLSELIFLDYIESVGELDKEDGYIGCLKDYEKDILIKIVVAENHLNKLLIDMLSILAPFKWEPNLGWFVLGSEYSIISTYKKWLLLETEGLLKNFEY